MENFCLVVLCSFPWAFHSWCIRFWSLYRVSSSSLWQSANGNTASRLLV